MGFFCNILIGLFFTACWRREQLPLRLSEDQRSHWWISNVDDIFWRRDHLEKVSFLNEKVGRWWRCWQETLGLFFFIFSSLFKLFYCILLRINERLSLLIWDEMFQLKRNRWLVTWDIISCLAKQFAKYKIIFCFFFVFSLQFFYSSRANSSHSVSTPRHLTPTRSTMRHSRERITCSWGGRNTFWCQIIQ